MQQKLISICIPTYNRPNELKRLLDSIDTTQYDDVDIVISENCSSLQAETRAVVEEFRLTHKYAVYYYENDKNIGYDKNIRALIQRSTGKFSMYFSDDDVFVPGAMDKFVEFVRSHTDVGYILRSYSVQNVDGSIEKFRYYNEDKYFPPGKNTYIEMFNKSVFLSGFTINTEYARQYVTDVLDGSLLFQLYQMANVCYRYPVAYSRIIISMQFRETDIHFFGECDVEKESYSGDSMTGLNNLNFLRWYMKVIDFIAYEHDDDSADIVKMNMSKLSYPLLSWEIHNNGKGNTYKTYCKELEKMGLTKSKYYKFYHFALNVFGVRICDFVVATLKKIIGHRPQL